MFVSTTTPKAFLRSAGVGSNASTSSFPPSRRWCSVLSSTSYSSSLFVPSTTSKAAAAAAVPQPSPTTSSSTTFSLPASSIPAAAPVLLLEYSDFYISDEGFTRTLYRMDDSPFTVEEIYDISTATKTYTVRCRRPLPRGDSRMPSSTVHDQQNTSIVQQIQIQEIDHGVAAFGTGSMTWEASIAAALYLNRPHGHQKQQQQQHWLHGDVLELGCGVGVGGILNLLLPKLLASSTNTNSSSVRNDDSDSVSGTHGDGSIHSMTFTDCEEEVLRHCRLNVDRAFTSSFRHSSSVAIPPIQVSLLDWNDFMACAKGIPNTTTASGSKKYHSIVACDCTYRMEDVPIICHTAVSLLHANASSQIHFFGPHNRAAAREVIRYLRDELHMCVTAQLFGADRCRLRPSHGDDGDQDDCPWNLVHLDQCRVITNTKAHFLHIMATRPNVVAETSAETLSDID